MLRCENRNETGVIRLNWAEAQAAVVLGSTRHMESLFKNRPDRYGYKGDGWTEHIEGAAGELVVAKKLGIYPKFSLNAFPLPDLLGNLQVRTRSVNDWDLIVRPTDNDEHVFILVTGKMPCYFVRGWLLGKDAKRTEWLKDMGGRPPAYFVPQANLNDIATVPRNP